LNSTTRNKNFSTVCKNSKTIIWKFGSWTWWKSDVETCGLDEKTDNQVRTWSKWGTWWKSVTTWWKSVDLDQSGFVRLSEDVGVWSASISLRHHLLCFPVFNYIDGTASIYGPSSIVIYLMLSLSYIFTNIFEEWCQRINEWCQSIITLYLLTRHLKDEIKSFFVSLFADFNRFQSERNRTDSEFQWFDFLTNDSIRFEIRIRNSTEWFDLKPNHFET
jgi:hypothetical protein